MAKMKVLLVEDERLLLQGLKKLVDWDALGFTVCETAENYLDALSAAYLCKPDLLVTDIMLGENRKTGLELVKTLSGLLPEMQAVVLTGYDRFAFAERAIEYSVRAYLLKPVKAEELTACLQKVRATFVQRQEERQNWQEINRRLRTAQPFLFDWFLSCAEDADWRTFFGLTGQEKRWQAVVLSCGGQTLYETYRKLEYLKNAQQGRILSFVRRDQLIYVLFAESAEPSGSADELARLLVRYCDFNGIKGYAVGIGRPVDRFALLQRCYDEAVSACRHIRFFSSGKCAYYADIALPGTRSVTGLSRQKEQLRFAVSAGHAEEAGALLRSTLTSLGRQGVSIEALRSLGIEGLVILNELAMQNALPAFPEDVWREVVRCGSLEELCDLLEKRCGEIGRALDSRRTGRNRAILEQVRRTIDREYAQNLTLENLAKLVYLSPPYLSVLFQAEFGVSVKDYLTGVRMETAKNLLLQGCKVYEVAEQVGYSDSRYFSQVFRKHVGRTPLEYRAGQKKAK